MPSGTVYQNFLYYPYPFAMLYYGMMGLGALVIFEHKRSAVQVGLEMATDSAVIAR